LRHIESNDWLTSNRTTCKVLNLDSPLRTISVRKHINSIIMLWYHV